MAHRFEARNILITGAASGIGLAVARLLAAEGAGRLILVDRDAAALGALDLGVETQRVVGDVADERLWDGVDLSGLDHAVVNAGIAGAGAIATLDFAEWRRILSVNLDGAFLTLRAAMRAMAGRGGSIVLTASAAGIKAEPGVAAYGCSKAALIHLAKVAAKEGAGDGIRVNAIAPAGVETPVWDAVPMFAERVAEIGRDAAFAELAAMATPLGRYAKAEEVAEQIAFLLSDQSALITGTTLLADGGYTL
ncbi:SDR family oxidoreductase [Sphingomonas sp. R647]|uniref:SDR family NAD(P)-dependent oxidoreductase n=1 Tax=Sphingomonas sp. R647 TaxID=2875233 RepID=UPI001CD508FC|nr:SDR family oxidoreductase [Sphingomonas sp. R647]MCA1198343.1 SDR family oxidoreductase [Sphingomonas sp. R647]